MRPAFPGGCKNFCWKALPRAVGIAEAEDLPPTARGGGSSHSQSSKALYHEAQERGEDWETPPLPALTPSDRGAHLARHVPPMARGTQPGLCHDHPSPAHSTRWSITIVTRLVPAVPSQPGC